MNEDQKRELKDILLDAQEHLFEAIELLKGYVKATDDQNADVYLISMLRVLASADHPYMNNSLNIDKLIERLDEDN